MMPSVEEVKAVLDPLDEWHHACHGASLKLVRSGVVPGSRVARGICKGVGAQHSWVVVGDPYDRAAPIIDPTLWSYDTKVNGIWWGSGNDGRHVPMQGVGSIWTWGHPTPPRGPAVALTPKADLSRDAQVFLDMLGPLDRDGWVTLMNAPVGGWPAGEIIAAMDDTEELTALVPIDLLGMLTDRNPGGLYLP